MPKMQLLLRSILVFSLAVMALGLSASGVMPLSGTDVDQNLFSGQIPAVTLNPTPMPTAPVIIGMNIERGFFSGNIVTVTLNPKPEPPKLYAISGSSFRSLFSGQMQTVTINPQPEPPGINL